MNKIYTTYLLFNFIIIFSACSSNQNQDEQANENEAHMTEEELVEKVKGIHERVITLDTHCDINVANFTDSVNYTQELNTQVNIPKMEQGGLDVAWLIVYTGQDELTPDGYQAAYENAMAKFDAIHRLCEEIAPDQIGLAYTSDDVRRIVASGKKVAMIGIENGYPIGEDISNVKKFAELGGRYMSLSHNGHSQLSDSNTGEADSVWLHNGLSDLGKQAIAEMNKWGIMIDISHPSKESMRQTIELSKAPIIASHSSARAVCDHSRNLDDEQLHWMKENGGVVQTVALGSYVNKEKSESFQNERRDIVVKMATEMGLELPQEGDRRAMWQVYRQVMSEKGELVDSLTASLERPNVSDFVDHIDYMVEKMGIDHVGISSDFDGGGGIDGWNDASETFNVTLELVRRGYTEEEIAQLWSGNLLRVLDEVQKIAQEIQSTEE